eukprot:364943-Chlamydomonas_euryale.AAC.5
MWRPACLRVRRRKWHTHSGFPPAAAMPWRQAWAPGGACTEGAGSEAHAPRAQTVRRMHRGRRQ